MTIFQSIFLGIIQGLSEFLPISSSAHLALTPYLLNWQLDARATFIFDILVQVATLVAVVVYFWKDLRAIVVSFLRGLGQRQPFTDPQARLGWLIIVATIPAGVIGFFLKDAVEQAFSRPLFIAIALLINALILLAAERLGKRLSLLSQLKFKDAWIIGLAQAAAIFPGISRSGSTIAGGMGRGLQRQEAARFSFLMSIPVMLVAGGYAALELFQLPGVSGYLLSFLPGFLAAAIVGYLSIRWLITFLVKKPLYVFSIYCALLGLAVLIVSLLRSGA